MENLAKIGIDLWSIALYAVNFGLIFAVIGFGLYPKLKKVMDQRVSTIETNLKDAEVLREKLEKLVQQSEKEKEELVTIMEKERERNNAQLQKRREELVSEMEAERTKMMEAAQSQIKKQQDQLIQDTQKQILKMMERTIATILTNDVDEAIITKSVKQAWDNQKVS